MNIYLYIKQCSHCNLKYFGKTKRDPYKYNGSGSHWKNHLKKHKAKPETIELFEFQNQKEATGFALQFSEYNCIVTSDLWANKIPEDAIAGGSAKGHRLGMPGTRGHLGHKHSEETKAILALKSTGRTHNRGRVHTEQTKRNMSQAHLGKKLSEEHKTSMRGPRSKRSNINCASA